MGAKLVTIEGEGDEQIWENQYVMEILEKNWKHVHWELGQVVCCNGVKYKMRQPKQFERLFSRTKKRRN